MTVALSHVPQYFKVMFSGWPPVNKEHPERINENAKTVSSLAGDICKKSGIFVFQLIINIIS